ncbi:MAG: capsule assembly Wzi family protein [Candidatus Eisenbacteria bacterium]
MRTLVLTLLLLAATTGAGLAAPGAYLPVGDPLEAELRVLDLYEPAPAALTLVHLNTLPLRWSELRAGALVTSGPRARALALRRIERALVREDGSRALVAGATPRLVTREYADGTRLELSAAVEGSRDWRDRGSEWSDGSGVHVRAGLQFDRWFAYSHLWAGRLAGVREYSDALVAGTDVAVNTDDSWLGYADGTRWDVRLGRSRWHWGPGEEGSLLLSRTAAPLAGAMLHARLDALGADLFFFDATVEPGRGEQLAAHRIEWQPRPWLRLGAAEAARYRSDGWQGLYLAGVIPYSIVQRLLDRDAPGEPEANRNNVQLSFDASARVADGTRLYGELLLDDVHAKSAAFPNKYGWQAGWDGAGAIGATRVTWNAEYTWLSRWVYSSYYGRTFAAQDAPLGFASGPGSRRLRLRASADPGRDLQCSLIASRTVRGEETLADAFVPGGEVPSPRSLAGVVETTRAVEGEARWWPATGVDVSVRAGREWREDAAHVAGASRAEWLGRVAVRLAR